MAEDVVVTPGETVERVVRVRLPPGLPPTFRGAVARVTYFITCVAATADARPEAPDPPRAWERAHARVPLRVRAPDGPTPREEGTSRVEAANPVSDAFAPRTPTFGSSFWMHELASAAGGTRSEPPGVAANETTGDGAVVAAVAVRARREDLASLGPRFEPRAGESRLTARRAAEERDDRERRSGKKRRAGR